ncbi:hypothetical protein DFH27DRAFT_220641 [Peziza echinospora]|nr:hypothetical protein DFH27DRAFT_220641 [Peziza echinospora]
MVHVPIPFYLLIFSFGIWAGMEGLASNTTNNRDQQRQVVGRNQLGWDGMLKVCNTERRDRAGVRSRSRSRNRKEAGKINCLFLFCNCRPGFSCKYPFFLFFFSHVVSFLLLFYIHTCRSWTASLLHMPT